MQGPGCYINSTFAGLIAKTVGDIKLLDNIFNSCPRKDADVKLQGLRIGVAEEWFHDIGDEVLCPCSFNTVQNLEPP